MILQTSHKAHLTTLASKTQGEKDVKYLQDVKSAICTQTTATNELTQNLIDRRGDLKSYVIKKFNDGRCWMNQNLAIGPSVSLNPTYSNVAQEGFLIPEDTLKFTGSINSGEMHIMGHTDNVESSYGANYNYYAQMAGHPPTGVEEEGTVDICPNGWQVPSGSRIGNNEFQTLFNAYGSNSELFLQEFIIGRGGGNWTGGGIGDYGSNGYTVIRTRTSVNDNNVYDFRVSGQNVISPGTGYMDRLTGRQVRCILKMSS